VADVVIDNPILNSPFGEPARHFRFGEAGITSEVVEERRASAYFVPIPAAKKKSQMHFDTSGRATASRRASSSTACASGWASGAGAAGRE